VATAQDRKNEQEAICRHKISYVGDTGTCLKCRQVHSLDSFNSNSPPRLVKRGRDPATGKPTMVTPPPLPTVEPEETGISHYIPEKPDNWDTMPPTKKGVWYDAHWAEFEATVKWIGLKKARKAWELSLPTYQRIIGRRSRVATIQVDPSPEPEPEPVVAEEPPRAQKEKDTTSKHGFYEENKEAILADLASLGKRAMLQKWGIPISSWTYLSRRWLGVPVKQPRTASSRKLKPTPKPTPETIEQGESAAGTRMARRNEGMTGIRILYIL